MVILFCIMELCVEKLKLSKCCFCMVQIVRKRLKIDDALDVFAVHGVGGIFGTLAVAVLASPDLGGTGYGESDMGEQVVTQIIAVAATIAWSAVATGLIIALVRAITGGLRAQPEHIEIGLDLSEHGERAFTP